MSVHAAETLHTEIQVTLMDRRTQQVVQIQDALARLADGRYGFCQECDAFIGVPRLRALPFAQRCRDCQAQAERRARREAILSRELPRESPRRSSLRLRAPPRLRCLDSSMRWRRRRQRGLGRRFRGMPEVTRGADAVT